MGKAPLQRAGRGCSSTSPLPWGLLSLRAGRAERVAQQLRLQREQCWWICPVCGCGGLCVGCVLGTASQSSMCVCR